MKPEHEQIIREKLSDKEEQGQFVGRCVEFLDYIIGDCMGLSPGVSFFEQSAFGLRHLGSEMPRYKRLFDDAADIYDTLVRRAPGGMYPRGSEIFDLTKVEEVQDALRDAHESEWDG